ncbi:unnamed protein product [Ectocarpus sp. 6 AP-2014]
MSHWWRKIQQTLPKPSSLKKTARGNLSFLEKKYGEVAAGKDAKDVRNAVRNTVKKSASHGKSARDRAEDATSRVGKQFLESARSIPSKAAEAAKDAATGAVVAGGTASKKIASAGAQSARDIGKLATDKVWDAAPKVASYATWTARRIVLLLLGTAFLYGVGSGLPGAVVRYFTEKDRRRYEEERRKSLGADGESSPSSSARAMDLDGTAVVEAAGQISSLFVVEIERWLRKR